MAKQVLDVAETGVILHQVGSTGVPPVCVAEQVLEIALSLTPASRFHSLSDSPGAPCGARLVGENNGKVCL